MTTATAEVTATDQPELEFVPDQYNSHLRRLIPDGDWNTFQEKVHEINTLVEGGYKSEAALRIAQERDSVIDWYAYLATKPKEQEPWHAGMVGAWSQLWDDFAEKHGVRYTSGAEATRQGRANAGQTR